MIPPSQYFGGVTSQHARAMADMKEERDAYKQRRKEYLECKKLQAQLLKGKHILRDESYNPCSDEYL